MIVSTKVAVIHMTHEKAHVTRPGRLAPKFGSRPCTAAVSMTEKNIK